MDAKKDRQRDHAKQTAREMLDAKLEQVTAAGYFGRVELVLNDGFPEAIHTSQIEKIPRPAAA